MKAVIFVVGIAGTLSLHGSVGGDELGEVLNGWRQHQERMSSVTISAQGEGMTAKGSIPLESEEGEWVPPEDHHFRLEIEWHIDFKEGRMRKDVLRDLWTDGRMQSLFTSSRYDGIHLLKFRPRSRNPRFTPRDIELYVKAEGGKRYFLEKQDKAVQLACGILPGKPLGLMDLRPKIDDSIFRFHGFGDLDGQRNVVIRSVSSGGAVERYFEMWADPSKHYFITRWILHVGEHISSEASFVPMQQDGEWLPAGWTFRSFGHDGRLQYSESIDSVTVTLNPTLPSSLFTVEEQPGMVVWDEVKDLIYIVPEPGDPVRTRAEVFGRARQNKTWMWSAAVATFVALAVLAFFVYRRTSTA